MDRRTFSSLLPLALAAALLACGGEEEVEPEAPADTATATAETPAEARLETGAAPDDLASLVSDIRAGIEPLPARVDSEPDAVREQAVELYVTRQEEIERRWGPNGERNPPEALARAVDDAEARFHALMEILNAATPPDSAAVAERVAALEAELDRVEAEARSAGLE
ncbi:MAG: hypothetical protein R3199_06300 [Gemmatimonadota bacterium]|nr:hypothetical protein [Gemmatimonadota bacterium]